VADEPTVFNRGSINFSAVHYDDLPDKRLASANALSAIVHPAHPRAPSIHVHISLTELREGPASWRLMADLNPSMPNPKHTAAFREMLQRAGGDHYERASAQGDRYFYIPAAGRHRGVCHFYQEGFATDDAAADVDYAQSFGEAVIDCYGEILVDALTEASPPTPAERTRQIGYHTLYVFQVLTLDRGTTSGLLVHSDNDLGIMGSLPAFIDRERLASWESSMPDPQRPLLRGLVDSLPPNALCPVDDAQKRRFAQVVRNHYRANPRAQVYMARGDVLPPTVANHGSSRL